MVEIPERLAALRAAMAEHHIDAWLIPSADPHQSEYVADHWSGRAWISGFTGSAGKLLVLMDQARLWTDGRYFIQAEQELEGSNIQLMKEGHPGVPSIGEWISSNLKSGKHVGFDGKTMSIASTRKLQKDLDKKDFKIKSNLNLLENIWLDRPAMPSSPVFLHKNQYAGQTSKQKLKLVRSEMMNKKSDYLIISSLDDIAWLFNIRGSDIECNPVFLAYTVLSQDNAILYINDNRIQKDALEALASSGVSISNYGQIAADLERLPKDSKIQLDPKTTSYWLMKALPKSITTYECASPSKLLKAIKNEVEITSMKNCHKRDGVAMVRFMRWLEGMIPSGKLNEVELDEHLEAFRAKDPKFKGPSFPTIAGYGSNAAICHYHAEKFSCLTIKPKGLLLVDSGGQYPDGTTDITRTFACGEMTSEEKHDYTLVLKSHINLATAHFKMGTRGIQLDMLARQPLWALGLDFNHGTGHGVGYFLNVHEGPQSISTRSLDTPFQPGMLITNEPGLYRSGKHGIRIENIMIVVEDVETEFGQFYKLESLTLAPIDTRPLVMDLLNAEDIGWLNRYHARVKLELSPLLDAHDQEWLQQATAAI